jgi:hypothetical protein
VVGVALVQGTFVYSPVVAPWSGNMMWGLLGTAASAAGWLLVFCPAWFPMLVPQKYPRVSRVVFAVCGLLLLLASGLLGLLGAQSMLHGDFSLRAPYALIGLATGVCFIRLAWLERQTR